MRSFAPLAAPALISIALAAACTPAPPRAFPPEDPELRADNEAEGDPHLGRFPLELALRGLPESGELAASLATDAGVIDCRLLLGSAPLTVANFVGLARGLRPFQNDAGEWIEARFYDGLEWHRAIAGQFVQTGRRAGFERSGFRIQDERSVGDLFDAPGVLAMANDGSANSSGTQFFITSAALRELDGAYTIFGRCDQEWVVRDLERRVLAGERPRLRSITIARGGVAAAPTE